MILFKNEKLYKNFQKHTRNRSYKKNQQHIFIASSYFLCRIPLSSQQAHVHALFIYFILADNEKMNYENKLKSSDILYEHRKNKYSRSKMKIKVFVWIPDVLSYVQSFVHNIWLPMVGSKLRVYFCYSDING